MGTKQQHEQLIDLACARDGWQRNGWKAALRKDVATRPDWRAEFAGADVERVALRGMPMLPDAWRLTTEDEHTAGRDWSYPVLVLEFLEVEVSSGLDQAKQEAYHDLWWFFDDLSCFALRVYHMDRFGVTRPYLDERIMDGAA